MGIAFGKPSIASVFDDVKFWANFPQEYARSGNWSNFYDAAQGLRIDQINSFSSRTNLPNLGSGFDCPNFNGSVYYRCSEAAGTTVDMAGPTTLVMWLKSFNMTERDTIFEKDGTSTNSYRQEIACTWETGETISWYSRPGNYDYGSTASIGTSGDWKMVSIKMSTAKISGTNRSGYYSIDGGNYVANYTSRSTDVPVAAGELRMGTGYAGAVEGGSMSQCLVWDRELSNTEINQVWEDTRSWHGR